MDEDTEKKAVVEKNENQITQKAKENSLNIGLSKDGLREDQKVYDISGEIFNQSNIQSYVRQVSDLQSEMIKEEVIPVEKDKETINKVFTEDLENEEELDVENKKKVLFYYNSATDLYNKSFKEDINLIDGAFELFNKALPLFDKNTQSGLIANTKFSLAYIYQMKHDEDIAITYFRDSSVIWKELGNIIAVADCLVNMAFSYKNKKDFDKAISFANEASDIYKQTNIPSNDRNSLNTLGSIYYDKGDNDQAIKYFSKCLVLDEKDTDKIRKFNTLRNIGEVYRKKKEFEKGFSYFKEAYDVIKKYPDLASPLDKGNVLVDLGNISSDKKKYKQSLKYQFEAYEIYKETNQDTAKSIILSNIGENLRGLKDFSTALSYFNQALEFSHIGNMVQKANCVGNIGLIHHEENKLDKAIPFYSEALQLYSQDPNHTRIYYFLDEMTKLDKSLTYDMAIESPYGQVWLFSQLQKKIQLDQQIEGDSWMWSWKAISKFWNNIHISKTVGTYSETIYANQWKLKQLVGSTQSFITSQGQLNWLLGCNELDSKHNLLRDEQRYLNPMWFVELPRILAHEEKYFKIRLNNFIRFNGLNYGYPSFNHGPHLPIERIDIQLEMPWYQKFQYDHIFLPNTEEENKIYNKSPQNSWLSDIYIIKLEDQIKKLDNLRIIYQIKVYFKANNKNPDIITTNQSITIPIIRKNRFQFLDKFRHNHTNSLAFLLILASIPSTLIFTLDRAYPYLPEPILDINTFIMIFAFIVLLIILFSKRINQRVLDDKIKLDKI